MKSIQPKWTAISKETTKAKKIASKTTNPRRTYSPTGTGAAASAGRAAAVALSSTGVPEISLINGSLVGMGAAPGDAGHEGASQILGCKSSLHGHLQDLIDGGAIGA